MNGDFDVNDKQRDDAPKQFQNEELGKLLDSDPCQTLKELSAALDLDRSTIEKRLHALGMVHRAGNHVLQELKERDIERHLVTCEILLQRQETKSFLHRIVTGDEKLIHYDNPKEKIGWAKPDELGPAIPRRNIHRL
ncbi:hypothetical protein Trydic_g11278 [Trypoxylus dichotomus]